MPSITGSGVLPRFAQVGGPIKTEDIVIILGLILLVLGYFLGIQILYYLGGLLLIVGVVLVVLGGTGRAIGGRRHYF